MTQLLVNRPGQSQPLCGLASAKDQWHNRRWQKSPNSWLGASRPMAFHWKLAGAATMGLAGPSFGFSMLQMI
jgi:hypothetical protein